MMDQFVPLTLLPSQMERSRKPICAPELALAAAVLEQAICDYQLWRDHGGFRVQAELAELLSWFASDAVDPFSLSFIWVCTMLEFNAEKLRNRLLHGPPIDIERLRYENRTQVNRNKIGGSSDRWRYWATR